MNKSLAIIALCAAPLLSSAAMAQQSSYGKCAGNSISSGESLCCEITSFENHPITFNAPGIGSTGKITLTAVSPYPRPQAWCVQSVLTKANLTIAGPPGTCTQTFRTNESRSWKYTVKKTKPHTIEVNNRTQPIGTTLRYILSVDTNNFTCPPPAFKKTSARICITDAETGMGLERYVRSPDGDLVETDADGCATFDGLDDTAVMQFEATK